MSGQDAQRELIVSQCCTLSVAGGKTLEENRFQKVKKTEDIGK